MKRYGVVDLETNRIILVGKDLAMLQQMIDDMVETWYLRRGRPYKLSLIEFTEIAVFGNFI